MHSGINTYIPRGIKGIVGRLPEDVVKKYSLESSIKMLEEGIKHTKKVYDGVCSFTNLIINEEKIDKSLHSLEKIISEHISSSAYKNLVEISEIGEFRVNKPLFCVAIDNLIKGGLKYNESKNKYVKIYLEKNNLCVEDNGVGMTKREFLEYCKPLCQAKTIPILD